ncbi:MAG: hypothetical protein GXY68_01755 [Chloroflexi bacterium]|jgi:hypothetical protein|nr:hypothetical protein [Chloroflexota bacterium]
MSDLMSTGWFRVLVALTVPVLWGVGTAWFFERLNARRAALKAAQRDVHQGGA